MTPRDLSSPLPMFEAFPERPGFLLEAEKTAPRERHVRGDSEETAQEAEPGCGQLQGSSAGAPISCPSPARTGVGGVSPPPRPCPRIQQRMDPTHDVPPL